LPKDEDKVNLKSLPYIGIGSARRNAAYAAGEALAWLHPGVAALRWARFVVCTGMLSGCAVSMPMASLLPGQHHDDDETSSIGQPLVAGWIDGEDWPHARPAFDEALQQKTADPVAWSNPKSGAKGKFVGLGQAYAGKGGECRAFHATVERQASDKVLDGTACADKAGSWRITDVKPAAKQS
jgi:surface antigen